ncbi:hypothetical protein BDZ91DRAFT_754925 [Kalaharituber pfeilii]|nr:hypothetical protein BDZ91DRAFT_754925 [Kalaharituber pfeilii]
MLQLGAFRYANSLSLSGLLYTRGVMYSSTYAYCSASSCIAHGILCTRHKLAFAYLCICICAYTPHVRRDGMPLGNLSSGNCSNQ